jgi:aminoglycoside phosphotransferase (APT) family kinase protein
MELDDRLAALLDGEPIQFSRSLAVDAESLTIVTMGVSGVPFGGVARHLTTPTSRRRASRWMELTGRAARLIEECTTGDGDDREDERLELLARRVERVVPWVSTEVADGLRRQVTHLYEQAIALEQPIIYTHGDFSPTNLLVDAGIGLIDFEWVPRLRHFDLANLVFRLEFDTGLPVRMVKPMVSAALHGYGRPDVVATPNWRLHRISNLLKVVRYGPRPWYQRLSGRTRRAFAELESLAGHRLSSR